MNRLKLALKVAGSKSATEKALIKLINDSTPDISIEKQLTPLVEGFSSYSGTIEGLELYESLLNYLKEHKPRLGILKTLYVAHNLINAIGEPFSKVFLSECYTNVMLNTRTNSQDDVIQGIFAANYYKFLLIYARYRDDLKEFKDLEAETLFNSMNQREFGPIIQLLTFKNILTYFTTVKDSLQVLIIKPSGLVKKITSLFLSDIALIYNIISKLLQGVIVNIFELEREMALLLDELYSDIIIITKKITKFIENVSLDIKDLPHFDFFEFNPSFNQKEEQFMISIRKPESSRNEEERIYSELMEAYQTFKVGRKEYKLDSKALMGGKINQLETKMFEEGQSPSLSSTKSSLMNSILSPRHFSRKHELQKSMTSPAFVHSKFYVGNNASMQPEIHSARNDSEIDNIYNSSRWERPDTLPDMGFEGGMQANVNNNAKESARRKNMTLADEILPSATSTNVEWNQTQSIAKKTYFSGLFTRKTKASRQIIPMQGCAIIHSKN